MKLLTALLKNIFGENQCGGVTMSMNITMDTPTHCSSISRYSTCGGDETRVTFEPAMELDMALLIAKKYTQKGTFKHGG